MSGRTVFRALISAVIASGIGLVAAPSLPATAASSAPGYSITGVITDRDSGDPLPGACISAYNTVNPGLPLLARATACADGDGRYAIANLPNGSFRLKATLAGRPDQWWPDATSYFNARLAGPMVSNVAFAADFKLRAQLATINGTVISLDSPARATALTVTVKATDGSWTHAFRTSADGTFTALVPAGSYHIGLSGATVSQFVPQVGAETNASTITVTAGQTLALSETLLPWGGTYTGYVYKGEVTDAASGDPIAGAQLTLVTRFDEVIATATSGADGSYATAALSTNQAMTVRVTAAGYTEQWLKDKPNGLIGTQFLVPGSTINNFALRAEAGHLQGTVTDPDRNGVPATILLNEGSAVYARTYAATDGTYDLPNLKPGSYSISINLGVWGTQYVPGKATAAEAVPVTIGSSGITHLDEQFTPRGSIRFTVLDGASGDLVTSVCARVTSISIGNEQCNLMADGSYEVTGVPPGTASYVIDNTTAPYYTAANGTATVTSGQTTQVTVKLRHIGQVRIPVPVQSDGSKPSVCAQLRALSPGGVSGYATCSASGADTVVLPHITPGTYAVLVIPAAPWGAQWLGTNGGTGDQRLAARIIVKAGETATTPAVKLDLAAILTGNVTGAVDPNNQALVTPYGEPGVGWFSYGVATYTDAGGYYRIDRLGPYSWPLHFTSSLGSTWSGGASDRYAAKLIKVTANQTTTFNARIPAGQDLKTNLTEGSYATVMSAVTGDLIRTSTGTVSGLPTGPLLVYVTPANCWYHPTGMAGKVVYLRAGQSITITPGVNCTASAPPTVHTPTKALIDVVVQAAARATSSGTNGAVAIGGPIETVVSSASRASASAFAAVANRQS